MSIGLAALVGNPTLSEQLNRESFVDAQFDLATIRDILAELAKPGRDPRNEFRGAQFNDWVNCLEDLKPHRILEGIITNVTHFGVFIDIGVHRLPQTGFPRWKIWVCWRLRSTPPPPPVEVAQHLAHLI